MLDDHAIISPVVTSLKHGISQVQQTAAPCDKVSAEQQGDRRPKKNILEVILGAACIRKTLPNTSLGGGMQCEGASRSNAHAWSDDAVANIPIP